MKTQFQGPLVIAGRVLLAILFLASGLAKVSKFSATALVVASQGVLFPEAALAAAAALELLGALFLIVGWRASWVALLLSGYCLVTAVLFHNFWAVPPEQLIAQQVNFLKNLSIAGGLLMVAALGAGPWSLDARRASQHGV